MKQHYNKKLPLFILCLMAFVSRAQDNCESALEITPGMYLVDQINGNANPYGICAGIGTATNSEWYKYIPSTSTSVTVTTDLQVNRNKDTRFHIYKGSCGALTCVGGDDDGGNTGTGLLARYAFNATANATYYIVFDNKWQSISFNFLIVEGAYTPEPSTVPEEIVGFTRQTIALTGSYKNCVADMNGDYLDDIVGISSSSLNILYQNSSGGFTPATITIPTVNNMPSWSVTAGDFDKNGYNDLVFGGGSGVTFLKANNTGNGYTKISGPQSIFCQRSNFVDLNNDGNLDAFVCHDINPNVYYINDGSGNLVFHQGGMGDYPNGGNYGSIFVDYDNDGDQDLFIAKCRGGNVAASTDELHRNNGNGTFTNVAAAAGLADPDQSWSSAFGDFDNDGYMDVLIGSNAGGTAQKLMRNNKDGTFTNVTAGSGFDTYNNMGREYIARDFNNDGFIDVYGPGGIIMINNGDWTFTKSGGAPPNGAIGDLNNDGFLDVQTANIVYFNNGNDSNWITINLKGIQSNSNGIGARVELYGTWGKQIRDVRSGEGFEFANTLNTHFGIGEASVIEKVIIKWPSGLVDVIENPSKNSRLLVTEGSTLGVSEANSSMFVIYPNPASHQIRIQLNEMKYDITDAKIYDYNGRMVSDVKIKDNTIDIQSLSVGNYMMVLQNSNGEKYSQKFIKK
ncbi:CRTAC1 family protein [Flavobacterium microcysteis]|uniref:T9SS type A sorting domain-containing protein n=1 Tax=Flavobacterium microcysteis TaxID=2596891 RepID=A0A501QKE4_9FLAO|nr:CRTAC1 family protein [Flavobacterium microcysteis]TPD73349.1 T9SS type A sorting domain-containing protein [Flavobacterium microcysteis]